MYSQAPQSGLASLLASRGRGEDTMLVHMTPGEVQALQGIASAAGGSLTLNPSTGLPEAGFLKELLPTIAGGFLKSVFPGMGELGIGLLTAGVSGLLEGDLKKGLTAGMGAYSGAKLTSGLTQLGREDLARKKWEQEGIKLDREKLATELGLTQVQEPQGGPRSNLIRGAMNLPVQPTVQMPDLEKLQEAYIKREVESTARQRPSMDLFKAGVGSLFKPKGFERFQTAVGGPKQAGFVVSPILGAIQRAEEEKARRKFARAQTPNYYYVPGDFDFESGTFAPGGYYTAPGQPYTPKTGFAGGGVVFQEGGETGTEALEQYYQGLLAPPDTSMGEARRTQTLDYINWLNNFLKQPITGAGGSAGDFYTGPTSPPVEDPRDFMPPSGGAPVGGMPPTTEPVVTPPPPSDVPDSTYIPPDQVPVDYIPPQPVINIDTEETEPETETSIEAVPEAGFEGVNPFAEDYFRGPPGPDEEPETETSIEAVPEAGFEGVNPFAEDYFRGPPGPDEEPEVLPIETKDWADLTPAEKRELGDMPPSDLGQSILEQYQSRFLTEPDLFLEGPSRAEVVDLLKQSPAPDINMPSDEGLLSRAWNSAKDLADAALKQIEATGGVTGAALGLSRELWKQVQEGKMSLEDAFKAAGKGAVPDALEDLIKKEEPAEEPAAEEATGAGGGGDGEYFSTFGRDPYSSIYRDIVYGGGGGRGAITVTQIEDKEPEEKSPEGKATGGIISNYNQDLGLANIAPSSPLSFMDTRPVGIATTPRGLGTEDLRMMARSGAAGSDYNFGFAAGGSVPSMQYAAGGKLLNGPGDGMSDDIKANIDGQQEARLADGEFVIPADVVSHLGNGSTKAGAQKLYAMMDRVRKARTGSTKQGREINPNKFIPA